MTHRIRVRGPAKATTGSPLGERQYWGMSDGELSGPRIKARLASLFVAEGRLAAPKEVEYRIYRVT